MTRSFSKHGFRRNFGGRSENKKIWIFTDAKETEKLYFLAKKREIEENLVVRVEKIKVISSKGKSTGNLINFAVSYIEHNKISKNDEFWLVFDRDKFDDFDKAIKNAKEKGFRIGYSNPCFEFWYLLHFDFYRSKLDADLAFNKLSEIFQKKFQIKYKKDLDGVYQLIKKSEENAVNNSKKILKDIGDKIPFSKRVPSTTVGLLVDRLNSLTK